MKLFTIQLTNIPLIVIARICGLNISDKYFYLPNLLMWMVNKSHVLKEFNFTLYLYI